jgi:hypothetical protein
MTMIGSVDIKLPYEYTPDERWRMLIDNITRWFETELKDHPTQITMPIEALYAAIKIDYNKLYIVNCPAFLNNIGNPVMTFKHKHNSFDEFIELVNNDIENDYYLFYMYKDYNEYIVRYCKDKKEK